jgi:hypothetical protein
MHARGCHRFPDSEAEKKRSRKLRTEERRKQKRNARVHGTIGNLAIDKRARLLLPACSPSCADLHPPTEMQALSSVARGSRATAAAAALIARPAGALQAKQDKPSKRHDLHMNLCTRLRTKETVFKSSYIPASADSKTQSSALKIPGSAPCYPPPPP